MDAKEIGKKGEKDACRFLRRRGYKIVECNYRCRFGEIDIIAENNEYLAFVEVKTRYKSSIANPSEFVNLSKQKRLIKTAEVYLMSHDVTKQPRFDVIEITNISFLNKKIELIENAFGV